MLRDSKRALPWRDPNIINPRQPHTLVGWNKAGDIYLVAVDGRQPGSDGVTMAEAADFLLDLGVTDAVSLDGGGGTTFVAGGTVWNRPSDNDPARPTEYEERAGTNALVVTSRPGAPLPPAAPPPPPPSVTTPSGKPIPGGGGGGMWSDSEPYVPTDGTVGVAYGPVTGVGGRSAAGDLPLGPASASRSAAASPLGAGAGDPAAPAPEVVSPPPTAGTAPAGDAGSEPAAADPGGGLSALTDQLVSVTAGDRPTWPLLGFVAGAALIAAGTFRRPRVLGRRRVRPDA